MGLDCQIFILNVKRHGFRSGERIKGTLRYSVDEPTEFETITISFKGEGVIKWTSDGEYNSLKEEYLDQHTTVLERKEKKNVGVYDHPFQFLLPEDLPSSLNHPLCKISYRVSAAFVTTLRQNNKEEFHNVVPVFGYLKPDSPEILAFRLTKRPFSLILAQKTVNCNINIQKTFLAPGEIIKINVMIRNDTHIHVSCIKFKLICEYIYITSSKEKVMKKQTIKESVREFPAIDDNVAYLMCAIPTLLNVYSVHNAKFFKRDYKLVITAKFPFPNKKVSLHIPVIIGERQCSKDRTEKCVVF
ncbi:unnamed protein product [Arctia plantaginis]|uniref:Arrestin C-terminal-like domain-containing protein n=1 Tax=Arctia plantaginis TaxID=874455 RepID=A0A8S1A0V5_ARCPL|nr:unnamed protein product [Arctia plantaginis]